MKNAITINGIQINPCPFCAGAPIVRETYQYCPETEDGPQGKFSYKFSVDCDVCEISIRDIFFERVTRLWNERWGQA